MIRTEMLHEINMCVITVDPNRGERSILKTINNTIKAYNERAASLIVVDVAGVGAAVADGLSHLGYPAIRSTRTF